MPCFLVVLHCSTVFSGGIALASTEGDGIGIGGPGLKSEQLESQWLTVPLHNIVYLSYSVLSLTLVANMNELLGTPARVR